MSGNLQAEMEIRPTGRKYGNLNPAQKEPCGHVHDTGCDAMNPAERALKHTPASRDKDKIWVKSTWGPYNAAPAPAPTW